MLRLWLNQAYRGAYQAVGMLREGAAADGLAVHVTGSHTTSSTPFLQACDDAFREPEELTGDAWVAFALQTCTERGIDVFVPGRERLAVARAEQEFADAGVRLMVSPATALALLDDKEAAHEAALALGVAVPHTHVVRDVEQFRAAYADLASAGLGVCVKPAVDHGGRGFRVLDERAGGWDDLLAPPSVRVHPDAYARALEARGEVSPLLVAELLDGPEVSVDVLSAAGELLAAVPRDKGGPQWTRRLLEDPEAVEIAATVVKGHGLRYLSNVQVRHGGGRLCLLEVNTRWSSGLFHSAASGLNLPYLALRLLIDGTVAPGEPRTGAVLVVHEAALEARLPF